MVHDAYGVYVKWIGPRQICLDIGSALVKDSGNEKSRDYQR